MIEENYEDTLNEYLIEIDLSDNTSNTSSSIHSDDIKLTKLEKIKFGWRKIKSGIRYYLKVILVKLHLIQLYVLINKTNQ